MQSNTTAPGGAVQGAAAAPRALPEIAEAARRANCPQCWAAPGSPCTVTGPPGDHLGRYARAERRGLITRAELAAVVDGLTASTLHTIIPGGAR